MSHHLVKQFSIPVFDLSTLQPKLVRRCTLEMQSQQLCPCVTGCLRAEQRAKCSKNLPGLGSVLRPLHFWNMSFFPPLSLLLMSADIRKRGGKTASVYFTANKWPCCWPPSQWPWEHLRCGQWGMCMVPACRHLPGRLHPVQPGHCLCSSYWCHLVSFWDEAGVTLCRQMDKGFCFLYSPSDLVACSRCYLCEHSRPSGKCVLQKCSPVQRGARPCGTFGAKFLHGSATFGFQKQNCVYTPAPFPLAVEQLSVSSSKSRWVMVITVLSCYSYEVTHTCSMFNMASTYSRSITI